MSVRTAVVFALASFSAALLALLLLALAAPALAQSPPTTAPPGTSTTLDPFHTPMSCLGFSADAAHRLHVAIDHHAPLPRSAAAVSGRVALGPPGPHFLDQRLLLVKDNVTVEGTQIPDSDAHPTVPPLPDYALLDDHDADIEFMILPDPNAPSTKALAKIVSFTPTNVRCEAVPFAREQLPSGEFRAVFRGWAESDFCAALRFDGRPFWTGADEAQAKWNRLRMATKIRVTGALVYDCFPLKTDDCLKIPSQLEIHPIYSIELLDPIERLKPSRPR